MHHSQHRIKASACSSDVGNTGFGWWKLSSSLENMYLSWDGPIIETRLSLCPKFRYLKNTDQKKNIVKAL